MALTTQAVILARGRGTRMRRPGRSAEARPLTAAQSLAADSGVKGMIPVGRPFLDYVLSSLADVGITDAVLVIGAEHEVMRRYFTVTARPERIRVAFATQQDPKGTADAVLAARDAVRDAPFLVLNADNFYPPDALRAVAALGINGLVAFEAGALVREGGLDDQRVLQYALVDFDCEGWLAAIAEKPLPGSALAQRRERWVSMNLWSFTPRIFEACARVTMSGRGELELQSAVTIAMRDLHERFRVITVRSGVLDLSFRADIAMVEERLGTIRVHP
ncbi:MAG TPA: nucleotidyltransferase family protein [Gemmatimonadaceae bacterium]|nr:nucleotidyltransferase family protein [Gemmatimonadaceae bacterium]